MLKTTGIWALTLLMAVFFLYVGYKKISGNEVTAQHFHEWGYAHWLLTFVGCAEIVGAILLLFPSTTTSGALMLCLIVTGASYTLLNQEVWKTLTITSVCLVLLLFLGYLRWSQSWILAVFKMRA